MTASRRTSRLSLLVVPAFLAFSPGISATPLYTTEADTTRADRTDTSRVSGQDLGTIRVLGTVVSAEGGVPVSGVQVAAPGTGRILRATTDERGSFSLAGVPTEAGPVELSFTRIGFAPASVKVTDQPDAGFARVEVTMMPRAVALAPVSVLIERTRMLGDPSRAAIIPGSAFVLGPVEVAASRMAFDNVHDILRQVPGVTIQDEEGYGLRPNIGLRGAGAERSGNVTLMEDGILIAPAPYAAPAAYYFPSMGRIEGVEVRKGASQIRYGPRTLGGAVNLLSASIPESRSWKAEIGAGEDAMFRGHVRAGDRTEHFGWMVEGMQLRTDGFKELETGGDTGFLTRDALGRFRVNSGRSARRYQELELKVGANSHRGDETYLGLTEEDFRATPNRRYAGSQVDVLDTAHRQLQLRYFLQPSASTDLVVTAYRNSFERNWYRLQSVGGRSLAAVLDDPASFASELAILRGGESPDDALRVRANNRAYLSRGIQAVSGARFEFGPASHSVEFGVRIHADEEDRLQWEDGYRMSAGTMVRTSIGVPGAQANRLGEAEAVAVHVQDEIRLGRWAVVPGVRWESISFTRTDWTADDGDRTGEISVRANGVSAVIPGIGATWEWTPRTSFFGGVHRGFGPPGPGADEATEVEESLNWEAGLRVRRAALGANLTAYFSDYSNILGRATVATGESGSGDLFNGGSVAVLGIESALDAELGRLLGAPFRIPARVSWTWTQGTFESDFQSSFGPWGTVERGDRLPYLPEHAFSGNLGVDDGARQLTLSWSGASAMRTEAGTGPLDPTRSADRFLVLNLRGEWQIDGQGTLIAGVQNLADRSYVVARRPAGARPGLPRTFFAGFSIAR